VAGDLTRRRLRQELDEHGTLEAAAAAQARWAEAIRSVQRLHEQIPKAVQIPAVKLPPTFRLPPVLEWHDPTQPMRAVSESFRHMKRLLDRWTERARRSLRRAELREQREARRASSTSVLSKRMTNTLETRREGLRGDAALVPCPPIVLARADLLEEESVRVSLSNRPGPKLAIRRDESLQVWLLHKNEGMTPRAIERKTGISRTRAQKILNVLNGLEPPL
jgi:hypothetical protein